MQGEISSTSLPQGLAKELKRLSDLHHESILTVFTRQFQNFQRTCVDSPYFFPPDMSNDSFRAELEESVPREHYPVDSGPTLSTIQMRQIPLVLNSDREPVKVDLDKVDYPLQERSKEGHPATQRLSKPSANEELRSPNDWPSLSLDNSADNTVEESAYNEESGEVGSIGSPQTRNVVLCEAKSNSRRLGSNKNSVSEECSSNNRPIGKYATMRMKRDDDKPQIRQGCASTLAPYILSPAFDYSVAAVVVLNTVMLGAQIHHEATGGGDLPIFEVLEMICSAIFLTELVLRVWVLGKGFCSPAERAWGCFDVFLVSLSILDLVMNIIQGYTGDTESMPGAGQSGKLLKVVRTARVMRILRMVRFLGELRVMVRMIISSTLSLLWLMILLFIMVYVFAILLTQGATDYLQGGEDIENYDSVKKAYGSLFLTMYTLFKAMTDGMSWQIAADALESVGTFYFALFLGYIFFTLFSVLNIVTGVFVDGAIQLANSDRALLIKKDIVSREATAQQLMELLEEIDVDNDGFITLMEFEGSFGDARVAQFLAALQVDGSSAAELFNLLDDDDSGEIDIDEFVEGMMRIRGEAKSLDMHLLKRTCKSIKALLSDHIRLIESQVLVIIESLANGEMERTYSSNGQTQGRETMTPWGTGSESGGKRVSLMERVSMLMTTRSSLPGSPKKSRRRGDRGSRKGQKSFEHLTLPRSPTNLREMLL